MQRPKTKSQKIESLVPKSLWSGEPSPFNLSALKKLTRESELALPAGEILRMSSGFMLPSALITPLFLN